MRNWYAVYTQPQKELKVALLLTKKGIENFCPVAVPAPKYSNRKPTEEALFASYVFVHITEDRVDFLRSLPGVINVLFWKSKPAIINKDEIAVIKQLTSIYCNIKLEKSFVDEAGEVKIVDEPQIAISENSVLVKYKRVKVSLPSLGCTMVAERMKTKLENAELQTGLLSAFPQKINSLFFN